MPKLELSRWQGLMGSLGIAPAPETFSQLEAAYSERHRHYHTVRHLVDCLSAFDEARDLAERPEEVEVALWFHDAIYKTASGENERRSAEWAQRFLASAGVGEERCSRVFDLILATVHDDRPLNGDAALMVDVDLSILGASRERFSEYEANIRREYRWVPGPLFRRKRAEILSSFLRRERIFHLDSFRERFERLARENLEEALERLRA